MPSLPEIIAAGELLIDLISTEYAEDFRAADTYQRLPGGSPANLAMNLARLGCKAGLVASVGRDDAGALLLEEVRAAGVSTSYVRQVDKPTTMILVTKSRAVSNFEPYRLADTEIDSEQFPDAYLSSLKVFHTTAFGLSKEPARSAILDGASRAANLGARLSIDANYAGKIWPDRSEALEVITQYLRIGRSARRGTLAKFSDVDYQRLFAEPVTDPHDAAARIMELGAGVVCLTLGEKGCYVLHENEGFSLPTRPVDVKDTTGAGDAFWSGFLAAYLSGKRWKDCALAGRGMAERKLTTVGPLRERVSVEELIGEAS